nr:MerR family transcriptional regulator [Paenibacillus sp. MMS18-CY102]
MTEDAIRHYEKIGLLPPIRRKANGHRAFAAADLEVMELITCLKKTGMTLEEMKSYVHFPFKDAIGSNAEMLATFQQYRQKITAQIADLQRILQFIDDKLDNRQSLLKQ